MGNLLGNLDVVVESDRYLR